jgi:hypothetical protein
MAVKWRNWKVQFYLLDQGTDPPLKLIVPKVYDVDIDPKEQRDVSIPEYLCLTSGGENHRCV